MNCSSSLAAERNVIQRGPHRAHMYVPQASPERVQQFAAQLHRLDPRDAACAMSKQNPASGRAENHG